MKILTGNKTRIKKGIFARGIHNRKTKLVVEKKMLYLQYIYIYIYILLEKNFIYARDSLISFAYNTVSRTYYI